MGKSKVFLFPSAFQNLRAAFRTITSTAYSLLLADACKYLSMNNAGAITITIPPHSSVPLEIGTPITVFQTGAGVVTITPGVGVTLNSLEAGLSTAGQYAALQLLKVDSNTWFVIGGSS